jgi:exodeoxyribonuclease VII small subunit
LPRFEESLQRLEGIVKEMEKGDLPLEQSLKLFEEGVSLSALCRRELEAAEGRVEILLKDDERVRAEAFGESSQNT